MEVARNVCLTEEWYIAVPLESLLHSDIFTGAAEGICKSSHTISSHNINKYLYAAINFLWFLMWSPAGLP